MASMAVAGSRYAFSVDEWHRMGEAGLFDEDSRVELVDGEVVQMAAVGNRHLGTVNHLTRFLVEAAGDRAVVSVQNPVRLDDRSEPQPDVALLHPRADSYFSATPRPADVFLLVEVADSSLAWDRDGKAPRYGAAGIPACWIVDMVNEMILVLSGPGPHGFSDLHQARRGEHLAVPGLPDVTIRVDDLLHPA